MLLRLIRSIFSVIVCVNSRSPPVGTPTFPSHRRLQHFGGFGFDVFDDAGQWAAATMDFMPIRGTETRLRGKGGGGGDRWSSDDNPKRQLGRE